MRQATEKPQRTRRRSPEEERKTARTYRVPWAELLAKVFAVDVLTCPECSGRMLLIAFIAQRAVAHRILEHLRLDSTGPPLNRARAAPEQFDPGPDYGAPDTSYES